MSSYPKVRATFTGGVVGDVEFNDQAFGLVGRVVVQLVTSGGWDDAIRVYRRIQGADRSSETVPWVRSAYRNESGQADVNNTTDMTAANIYTIYCDGTDVKLEHQGSGSTGTVTVIATAVAG